MKTIRCFLALNLEIETMNAVAQEQFAIKQQCDAANLDIRWVPPQNMHVTIRFLGQITEPMIKAIKDGLEPLTNTSVAFSIDAEGLGAFPSAEEANALWVGIKSKDKALDDFYTAISKVLEETGFKSDSKPFKSHLTLGRVKGKKTIDFTDFIKTRENLFFGKSIVTDLLCYRSDLHPKGADYHLLWRLPLTGKTRISKPDIAPSDEKAVDEKASAAGAGTEEKPMVAHVSNAGNKSVETSVAKASVKKENSDGIEDSKPVDGNSTKE